MLPLLILILGGTVFLWVILPSWWKRESVNTAPEESAFQELLLRKETLLTSARELDFDLQTDKLSPEDHRDLRSRCQAEAVAVMERLETLSPPRQIEAAATKENFREEPRQGGAARDGARLCPRCGNRARPPYRFCTACGSSLEEGTHIG